MIDEIVAFIFITMSHYSVLASAIYNDIMSGLRGYSSNPTISLDQLEDDVIDERLQLIKEYSLKGLIPKRELLESINCITVDCKDIENCSCGNTLEYGTPTKHFEVPQLLTTFDDCIEYIGSVNKQNPFIYYTNLNGVKYHKYRKRGVDKPYVYVDTTPNQNGMNDCWVFNAPLLKKVSIVAIFKDPRQLCGCEDYESHNKSFLDAEIKRRLTEKKIKYYRQFAHPITNNDQTPK